MVPAPPKRPCILDKVRDAYGTLGLCLWDSFARQAVERNQLRAERDLDMTPGTTMDHPQIHRRIGSTTWMTVYAVVKSINHWKIDPEHYVFMVTQTQPDVQMMKDLLEASGYHNISAYERQITYAAPNLYGEAKIAWTVTQNPEEVRGRVGIRAEDILRDPDFKARLVRRLGGPFEQAHVVYQMAGTGRYYVFGEDDEYLFETTEVGAKSMNVRIQTIT